MALSVQEQWAFDTGLSWADDPRPYSELKAAGPSVIPKKLLSFFDVGLRYGKKMIASLPPNYLKETEPAVIEPEPMPAVIEPEEELIPEYSGRTYTYGSLSRPVSKRTVPEGFVDVGTHLSFPLGVVVYTRPLTPEEMDHYSLQLIPTGEDLDELEERLAAEIDYPNEWLELLDNGEGREAHSMLDPLLNKNHILLPREYNYLDAVERKVRAARKTPEPKAPEPQRTTKASRAVEERMAEKVDLRRLEQPGTYPDLHTKLALELATEIERESDPNYVSVSWPSQEKAQDYFNEHGFVETLDYMIKLREENDRRAEEPQAEPEREQWYVSTDYDEIKPEDVPPGYLKIFRDRGVAFVSYPRKLTRDEESEHYLRRHARDEEVEGLVTQIIDVMKDDKTAKKSKHFLFRTPKEWLKGFDDKRDNDQAIDQISEILSDYLGIHYFPIEMAEAVAGTLRSTEAVFASPRYAALPISEVTKAFMQEDIEPQEDEPRLNGDSADHLLTLDADTETLKLESRVQIISGLLWEIKRIHDGGSPYDSLSDEAEAAEALTEYVEDKRLVSDFDERPAHMRDNIATIAAAILGDKGLIADRTLVEVHPDMNGQWVISARALPTQDKWKTSARSAILPALIIDTATGMADVVQDPAEYLRSFPGRFQQVSMWDTEEGFTAARAPSRESYARGGKKSTRPALKVSDHLMRSDKAPSGKAVLAPEPTPDPEAPRVEPKPIEPKPAPELPPFSAKAPVPKGPRSAADLAAEYKARRMERTRAWSEFVKDRGLRPEMNAKDFYAIFDQVGAYQASQAQPTPSASFIATHFRPETNERIMVTSLPSEWGIVQVETADGKKETDALSMLKPISEFQEDALPSGVVTRIELDDLPEGVINRGSGRWGSWEGSLAMVETEPGYSAYSAASDQWFDPGEARRRYRVRFALDRETRRRVAVPTEAALGSKVTVNSPNKPYESTYAKVYAGMGRPELLVGFSPSFDYWVAMDTKDLSDAETRSVVDRLRRNGYIEVDTGKKFLTKADWSKVLKKARLEDAYDFLTDATKNNALERFIQDTKQLLHTNDEDYAWSQVKGVFSLSKEGKIKMLVDRP